MAIEIRAEVSRGESRKLRLNPETVYTDTSKTREYRVAVTRSGEFPHPTALLVQRYDYISGRWQAGTDVARFSDTDRSRRSIAAMAIQRGCDRRRV